MRIFSTTSKFERSGSQQVGKNIDISDKYAFCTEQLLILCVYGSTCHPYCFLALRRYANGGPTSAFSATCYGILVMKKTIM